MIIKIKANSLFIFDLDDTIYKEIDYLKSAYAYIDKLLEKFTGQSVYEEMMDLYFRKENVFVEILERYKETLPKYFNIDYLLKLYRNHQPILHLQPEIRSLLDVLKAKKVRMGMITDGRSITQRNKIKALKIDNYFSTIIISEEFGSQKPDARNFLIFEELYPNSDIYFFGDNTSKDFQVPEHLGWTTVCIEDLGDNIHAQKKIDTINHYIKSFTEIILA